MTAPLAREPGDVDEPPGAAGGRASGGRSVLDDDEGATQGGVRTLPAAPGAGPALEAVDLVRGYGPVRAVDGISFEIDPGDFLTVFGPNGAGKTTLLRVLAGGLHPERGVVRIGGTPVDPAGTEWRRRLGVLSHQSYLYGHLTAAENLRFYGTLFGLEDLDDRVPARLEEVDLLHRADHPARSLSRGMRQRLALARTLLHDPEVVLLDEPWTGLDAHAADVLRGVLARLKDGRRTVVLVTHNLTQGLEMADRVVIQARGRFVWDRRRAEVDADGFGVEYRQVVERAQA